MSVRPNCMRCIHYFVTHDPSKPHGCRAMRFKSARSPASLVYASSGMECQLFVEKKKNNNPGGSKDGGLTA